MPPLLPQLCHFCNMPRQGVTDRFDSCLRALLFTFQFGHTELYAMNGPLGRSAHRQPVQIIVFQYRSEMQIATLSATPEEGVCKALGFRVPPMYSAAEQSSSADTKDMQEQETEGLLQLPPPPPRQEGAGMGSAQPSIHSIPGNSKPAEGNAGDMAQDFLESMFVSAPAPGIFCSISGWTEHMAPQ